MNEIPQFVPTDLYSLDEDGKYVTTRDPRNIESITVVDHINDYLTKPFWVRGLDKHDLAIFAGVFDEEGVSQEGFVVTEVSRGRGTLIRPADDGTIPAEYITHELASNLISAGYDEVAQLGLERILLSAREKYPNMKIR